MVVHFSSKLSHFAPSFRPQQPTFSFTRNAFPPAPPPPGPSAYGSANAVKEGQSHQPGAGASGSAAGGGHKWHAGRAPNWGFQPQHTRIVAQPLANADTTSRLNDEDDPEQAALRASFLQAHSPSRRPLLASSRRDSSSALTPPSTPLLNSDEAGLSGVRLSGVEMQERYRLAFIRGEKTPEVREMEIEADEMDLGPRQRSSSPRGRSASLHTSKRPVLSTSAVGPARALSTTGVAATPLRPQQRAVHSSSSAPAPSTTTTSSPISIPTAAAFPRNSSPPYATTPRVRRNSTSAVEASSPASESSSPPLADVVDFSKIQFKEHKVEGRPRHSSQHDRTKLTPRVDRRQVRTEPAETVWGAVAPMDMETKLRQYRANESTWTSHQHVAAMKAIMRTREKHAPITPILELYNHLFERENLRPNLASYDIILRAFTTKDRENAERKRYLENRMRKKRSAIGALGNWAGSHKNDDFALDEEIKAIKELESEDYFTPAIQVYTALARQADSLDVPPVNNLLERAAARGRVDVALALFGRLEKSPLQHPNRYSFEILLTMYGKEKDADGLMAVFDAFLAARKDGLQADRERAPAERFSRGPAVKHRHDTAPTYVRTLVESDTTLQGDAAIWGQAIGGLFVCGDAPAAVALLDRLLAAQAQPESLPAGYPAKTSLALVHSVVRGLVLTNDFDSAKRWFDKVADPALPTLPKRDFYHATISAILDSENRHRSAPFMTHVYRALLARAGPGYFTMMSEFVSVTDYLVVEMYSLTDKAARNAILTDIAELRTTFQAAVQQGFHDPSFGPNDPFSTGFLNRLVIAYGTAGRYDESLALAQELAATVSNAPESFRTPHKWALAGTNPLPAVLGYEPVYENGTERVVAYTPIPDMARPLLRHAIATITLAHTLGDPLDWYVSPIVATSVVELYLAEREAAQGDFASLGLAPDAWFQVIRAFAAVAALQARGLSTPANFPGFEPIVDDFYASGVQFGEGNLNNYAALARTLREGGFGKDRITAIVSVLDPWLAEAIANGTAREATPVESVAAPSESGATEVPLSQASVVEHSEVESVADTVAPSSIFPSSPSAASLATPPSSPPAEYLRDDLPASPDFDRRKISAGVTQRLEGLVQDGKRPQAHSLVISEAREGRYAHPEEIGRLIDILGRAGQLEQVREVYLVAYDALAIMTEGQEAQSLAWAHLEDRMIVALAQAGRLDEVAVHRLRLLNAGMAPSADAYAAMILNMKETTNDAAVALALFDESQRHGVPANVYLFNTLISKLSRARRAREALEYFELMKETGLVPTSITYGAVLNACCKTGDDVSAELLFKEMVQSPGFRPRVPPYNTMIQFYTQTKPDRTRALYFYDAMTAAGVAPTGHTYKLLLDAYGSVGTPEPRNMSVVFDKLLKDRDVSVTGAHWASLINSWGCVSKDLERARSIFDSVATHPSTLKSKANLPDAVVYEALLNACIANGRSDLCKEYLADMQSKGIHVTAYVANTLITAHIAQNDIESARAFFESMQDPPVGVAAPGNHNVDRYPKHHHQAGHLPASRAEDPIYREPSSWDLMIRAEIAAGEMERAAALLARVEERAFPEGVVNRIRKLLTEHGLEPAAEPTPVVAAASPPTPSPTSSA
ncbi:hypothetical protein RQP46_009690 [Phenoliferia psychrophenolica]